MKTKQILTLALALAAAVASMAQPVSDSAWRSDVHTVLLYSNNNLMEQPVAVLDMGVEGQRLVLEFDVLRTEAEQLRWSIAHCDAQWRRDDLEPAEFMTGFESGPVESYDFSFTTRTDYVHYHTLLPDRYTTFMHSGNYVVYVVDETTGDTLLSRRFAVCEHVAKVDAAVVRPYDGNDLERRQQVDVCVSSREVALQQQWLSVVVQQNGRTDNSRQLSFSGYDGAALCYRNRQPNIFDGGNTYRFFDMSNLRTPMYNVVRVQEYGGELMAIIKPCDNRSRSHYIAEVALLGGMKVNIWDRNNPQIEADYVWVNISLPSPTPMLDGEVYVVGALTDWRLDTVGRMDYDMKRHAYTARLLLKQGYYAYQLLFRPMHASQAETARIEGDHYETANRYTVYVYQHSPADRADRLLAVGQATR